jgi:phenylpropionate dioxygenase-like ring-hydroxylating dioxygenase large terminal subunit
LGDRKHAEISDYEVTTDEKGSLPRTSPFGSPTQTAPGSESRLPTPTTCSAYFTKRADQVFSIYFNVTPVDVTTSVGWMCEALNYAHDLSAEELRRFQDEVTAQDVPVVVSQRPELLPLDLQTELHLRSDKTSIAYRRWLNELGLTFGTA